MKRKACQAFANGMVYMLETEDDYPVEVTDLLAESRISCTITSLETVQSAG